MAEENPKTPPTSPNKRHRVSAGTAEKLQPAKKSRTEGKEKSRSAFLLLITKDGTNYKHLNDEEYQSLMLDMATSLRKSRPVGGYPHIDWHSKTAGRSLMACDDEHAVTWVKTFVANLNNGVGAWLAHEGPNMHALQCMVPHPTGKFNADEILEQIKKPMNSREISPSYTRNEPKRPDSS